MKEPVVVRTDVSAATSGFFMGRREQLIADELRRSGIPAIGGTSGITVSSGTLEAYEEEGLRVYKWTPPEVEEGQPEKTEGEDRVVHVPVPPGFEDRPETQALREQTEQRKRRK